MTIVLCVLAALLGLAGATRVRSFFWSGGLLIGAIAAVMYAIPNDVAFKIYYAFGASMLPGWIGVGSLQVAFGRKLARWPGVFVILLSALQLGLTMPATVSPAALANLDGSNGAGVLVMGGWVVPTVLFNTFGLGFAAVAAFFAWFQAFRIQDNERAMRAIGLSIVVLGILARSDGVYQLFQRAGAGSLFILLDVIAFGLIWAGAEVSRLVAGRRPEPVLA
ncbi:MAG: hypothetical protein JO247_11990 [Chloroflexi bacterium]|nr:hypothetical protein [Chloroflexota bacterium]